MHQFPFIPGIAGNDPMAGGVEKRGSTFAAALKSGKTRDMVLL
jgi:hypothetical protein